MNTGARSRTLSGGFGDRQPSREHTGKHSTGLTTGKVPPHSSSSTFQYASLTNRAQLSIRAWRVAYCGRHTGLTGAFRRGIRDCWGVRSALRLLQETHASTQFSHVGMPPCERGTTWSTVNSSLPGCAPQYWHVYLSRR
jgi:hypothetical protein